MASDLYLQDINKTLYNWVSTIAECVTLECSSINLVPMGPIERDAYGLEDTRRRILVESTLNELPLPMQTLLKALMDLKIDIAKDRCRQRTNYEAIISAKYESVVSCVAHILRYTRQEKQDILNVSTKTIIDPVISDIQSEFALLCHKKTDNIDLMLKDLRQSYESIKAKLFDSLKETSTVRPILRPSIDNKSARAAYDAAESNNNDIILLDGQTAHTVTEMLTVSKNRIHFVGMDG
jgi:hypothetical protein